MISSKSTKKIGRGRGVGHFLEGQEVQEVLEVVEVRQNSKVLKVLSVLKILEAPVYTIINVVWSRKSLSALPHLWNF
jgi:hypothetical protein